MSMDKGSMVSKTGGSSWMQFTGGLHTLRFAVFLALFILMCVQESASVKQYLSASGYRVSYSEQVLLLLYSGMGMPYTTIAFMVLSDVFSPYPSMNPKAERTRWVCKQLAVCAYAAALMLLLSILIALALSISGVSGLSGWFSQDHRPPELMPLFSPALTNFFSPLRSIGAACLILLGFWLLTSTILMFFHLLGAAWAGVLLWGFALFSTTILSTDSPNRFLPDMRFSLFSITRFSADIKHELLVTLALMLLCACVASACAVCASRSDRLSAALSRKELNDE
jgi:hypothetical protein